MDTTEETGRKLTNRQKEFARHYVEGIYSNAECARKAGYATASAASIAGHLLAGKKFPHLVDYIQELREERERKYGVTIIGQLKRLHDLSSGAEEAGQFSAAINAEQIRSPIGGPISGAHSGSTFRIVPNLALVAIRTQPGFQIYY